MASQLSNRKIKNYHLPLNYASVQYFASTSKFKEPRSRYPQ